MGDGNDGRSWWSRREELLERYEAQSDRFSQILKELRDLFRELLTEISVRGYVRGRVKSFDSFYRKLLERSRVDEFDDPFTYVTDILAFRIVTPFLEDLKTVESELRKGFSLVEVDDKATTLSISEFGYDSTHLLVAIPEDTLTLEVSVDIKVAEVQLRTTLQHAWAQVEHELVYKSSIDSVDDSVRRKLIAINATLSLADTIFQEIRDHQGRRYSELRHRHQKLMDKVSTIPEKMGHVERLGNIYIPLAVTTPKKGTDEPNVPPPLESTVDDTLVRALQAHLDTDLDEAVELYSQVLAVRPVHSVYNDRGITYFALSQYTKAIADFTTAIELQPTDARAFTNRGLAHRMAGNLRAAHDDFDHSLELNPMWADTLYGRALTHFDLGNIPAAMRDCDHAIAIKPDFKQVHRFKRYLQDREL